MFIKDADWPEYLADICKKNNWQHTTSPLVWRQLGEGNTAASYIGGADATCALIKEWYGIVAPISSEDTQLRAADNVLSLKLKLARPIMPRDSPTTICVVRNPHRYTGTLTAQLILNPCYAGQRGHQFRICLYQRTSVWLSRHTCIGGCLALAALGDRRAWPHGRCFNGVTGLCLAGRVDFHTRGTGSSELHGRHGKRRYPGGYTVIFFALIINFILLVSEYFSFLSMRKHENCLVFEIGLV